MQNRPLILHIVDDTTPGGVTRVLDHITDCPQMARTGDHVIQRVGRGKAIPRVTADIVVSHQTLNWRTLPQLISFRARHATTPFVHVEHSYTEAFTALNVSSTGRFLTMLRASYAMFDRVVAVSKAQAEWLSRRGLVRESALRTIASAVDLSEFRAIPAPQGEPRRFGAIGRLDRQKGFDLLIDSFRALKRSDTELHFFGTGDEEAVLRERASKDSRIHFHGYTASPAKAMAQVDMVVMPSRWEAFGLVALESRAAGRPLALAPVDGLRDQNVPGTIAVTGYSVRDWTAGLENLISLSESELLRQSCLGTEHRLAKAWHRLVLDLLEVQLHGAA